MKKLLLFNVLIVVFLGFPQSAVSQRARSQAVHPESIAVQGIFAQAKNLNEGLTALSQKFPQFIKRPTLKFLQEVQDVIKNKNWLNQLGMLIGHSYLVDTDDPIENRVFLLRLFPFNEVQKDSIHKILDTNANIWQEIGSHGNDFNFISFLFSLTTKDVLGGHQSNALRPLFNRGLSVNISDARGTTPLMGVSLAKAYEPLWLDEVLRLKPDVNAQDTEGFTALMYSIEAPTMLGLSTRNRFGIHQVEIARKLIAAGADKHIRNNKNQTAYDLAKNQHVDPAHQNVYQEYLDLLSPMRQKN